MISLRILMLARKRRLLLGCLLAVILLFVFYVGNPVTFDLDMKMDFRRRNFIHAVAKRASPDRFVILAMVDAPFVDMAINLHVASFQPFGIENFLFVGAGKRACDLMSNHSLPCFHYTDDKDTDVPSVFGSLSFIRKMNIRTEMIIEALDAGFTVLHMDLDIAFLKNPVSELMKITENVDIAAMWDSSEFNAGFVVAHPTRFSKMVYARTKAITMLNQRKDDQKALNSAIKYVEKNHKNDGFKAIALNRKRYLCGLDYFEIGNRFFPSNCTNCAVVHNNWIVSKEAKVYRFKEHLMWWNDADEYYTSLSRGYIIYDNPVVWGDARTSITEELEALKAAFAYGQLLGRIVILPRFHCYRKTKYKLNSTRECALNSFLKLTSFDSSFAGRYRENSFLSHPLVPDAVKRDQSVPYIVLNNKNASMENNQRLEKSIHSLVGVDSTVSVELNEQLVSKLTSNQKVLRFHSLYRATPLFPNETDNLEFEKKVKSGFKRSGYEQT